MKIITRLAAAFAATAFACVPAAAQKTSALPPATTLSPADAVGAIQGTGCPTSTMPCTNVKMTLAQISGYVAASPAAAAAYQPLDADLTAIAAQTTTATGRGLLTSADAAAIRTRAGLGTAATANTGTSGATVPLLNGANTWAAPQTFGTVNTNTVTGSYITMPTGGTFNQRFTSAGVSPTYQITDAANTIQYGAMTFTTSGALNWTGAVNATNIGTAAAYPIGTSGATVPLLNGANTWSAPQTFTNNVIINGATSAFQAVDRSGDGSSFYTYDLNATYRFSYGPSNDVARIFSNGNAYFAGTSVTIATTSTPASSTAACTAGEQRWDANFEYRCVATNSWKRAALAAW